MKAFISAKENVNVIEILNHLKESFIDMPAALREYSNVIFNSKDIQNFIVEANIRLLEEGRRPDLTQIEKIPEGDQKSSFYERLTIYNRSEEGKQTAFVDLHDTGFFYRSLKVKAGSQELLEFSTDPKAQELERVWGNILGISQQDLYRLQNIITPKIIEFINDKLKFKK